MIDFRNLNAPPDFIGNAMASFQAGRQTAATQQAGNALAAGNPMGAQNAYFSGGMVDQGLALQDQQRQIQRQQTQDQRAATQDQRQAQTFDRQQTEWGNEDQDRLRSTLLREAKALRLVPPAQRVAAYRQRSVPLLRQMGVSAELLEGDFLHDEALSDAELDAFEAQMGGASDPRRPVVVNPGGHLLSEDGTPLFSAPFAPQLRAVGEGQELHMVNPGGAGGGPMAGPTSALDFSAVDQLVAKEFGVGVNSATRTPERNAQVDGVPNSYHLSGQARDYPIPQGMTAQQFAAQLQARVGPGYEVIPEPRRNHVHIEPAPQRGGGSTVVARGAPKFQPRPATAAEKAEYNLPPDYPATMTEDGLKPLVGAESITKRDEKGDMRALAAESRRTQAAFINGTVDEALSKLGAGEAGMLGQAMAGVAGTKSYDLAQTLTTIKANLGFQELAAMRAASPTGGALGAIAVQELQALQATVASLDQGQSEAQLRANLNKVKRHYDKWLDAVARAEGQAPAAPTGGGRGGGRGPAPSPARRPALSEIFR
jgi:hypothetical protein